jgi:putative intracellular protease/amidase
MSIAIFVIPQIGFNDFELLTIREILQKNKIECQICSFALGKVISKTGVTLNATKIIGNIETKDFDCLIFVGGENVSSLSHYKCVIDLIKQADIDNKKIVLLCMNPAILLPKAGLMEGRKVTVFESKDGWSKESVRNNKGILVDEHVVVDGNIISSRNEEDSTEVAKTIVQILNE